MFLKVGKERGRIDDQYNLVELLNSSYPHEPRETSKKVTAP
jgi:hypothetical protein